MNKQRIDGTVHTISLILTWGVVLGTAFSAVVGYAEEIDQPPHASPAYNQRFLKDQLAPILKPGRTFYVAVHGSDDNPGTQAEPFASLEAARDAIRSLKTQSGLPKGGVHVVLLEGTYRPESAFVLEQEDSGTAEAPIVYCGVNRDKVMVSGGVALDLSGIKTVADLETLERLHPSARGQVVVLDVADTIQGCFPDDGNYGMIAMDGHLLTLAQWPNVGYHHINTILEIGPTTRWLKPDEKSAPYSKEKPTGGQFTVREALSSLLQNEFERSGDMLVQGYLHNDWFFQAEQVGRIEGEVIQLLRYTRYGIVDKIKSIPRRVRLVNVLAELDRPGEWYYDRVDGRLFIWPIKGFDPETSTLFALTGKGVVRAPKFEGARKVEPSSNSALVILKETSYVTLRDITFEKIGNQAVDISGGQYNLVAGGVIRNGLNKGVSIRGGHHNGITGCDFYGLETAFSVSGGDFKLLRRCYNFATNNDISACRRRGYGMIGLDGVGLYFGHNLLHDMNGAVTFKTADSLLEFNEFYNIGYEMGDFNVAYTGALWHTQNNVVRYNFVHHLLEPGGHPVMAFRNDDNGMGLNVYGNIFYRSGRGAAQGDGALNTIQNNIAIEGYTFWWTLKKPIDREGIAKQWKSLERFGRDLPHGDKGDNLYILNQLLGERGWESGVWKREYPRLAEVINTNPFAQTFGNVSLNYMNGIRNPFHIHGGSGTVEGMESNKRGRYIDLPKTGTFHKPDEIPLDAFVSIDAMDFNFKPGFKPMPGFKPIPFNDMGLLKDEFRDNPPSKDYRQVIYHRFKNDHGGRYNAEKVNARYPIPAYLKKGNNL